MELDDLRDRCEVLRKQYLAAVDSIQMLAAEVERDRLTLAMGTREPAPVPRATACEALGYSLPVPRPTFAVPINATVDELEAKGVDVTTLRRKLAVLAHRREEAATLATRVKDIAAVIQRIEGVAHGGH